MTPRSPSQLRCDARSIWQAAVEAVRSDRLVQQNVRVEGNWLIVAAERIDLAAVERIVVVGRARPVRAWRWDWRRPSAKSC